MKCFCIEGNNANKLYIKLFWQKKDFLLETMYFCMKVENCVIRKDSVFSFQLLLSVIPHENRDQKFHRLFLWNFSKHWTKCSRGFMSGTLWTNSERLRVDQEFLFFNFRFHERQETLLLYDELPKWKSWYVMESDCSPRRYQISFHFPLSTSGCRTRAVVGLDSRLGRALEQATGSPCCCCCCCRCWCCCCCCCCHITDLTRHQLNSGDLKQHGKWNIKRMDEWMREYSRVDRAGWPRTGDWGCSSWRLLLLPGPLPLLLLLLLLLLPASGSAAEAGGGAGVQCAREGQTL